MTHYCTLHIVFCHSLIASLCDLTLQCDIGLRVFLKLTPSQLFLACTAKCDTGGVAESSIPPLISKVENVT